MVLSTFCAAPQTTKMKWSNHQPCTECLWYSVQVQVQKLKQTCLSPVVWSIWLNFSLKNYVNIFFSNKLLVMFVGYLCTVRFRMNKFQNWDDYFITCRKICTLLCLLMAPHSQSAPSLHWFLLPSLMPSSQRIAWHVQWCFASCQFCWVTITFQWWVWLQTARLIWSILLEETDVSHVSTLVHLM